MTFNPKKCNTMTVALKKSVVHHDYTMLGETLEHVKEHTYLGVTISNDLTWESNYRRIIGKANRILGLLQRNIYQCSKETKAKAYKALVRPHLEYAAVVTDPHQTKYIEKLEKVQRRAARFVMNDFHRRSSVSKMIQELEWESLANRRLNARLCQFYQIHSGEAPVTCTKLHTRDNNHESRHYSSDAYDIIKARIDRYKFSFFPWTVSEWNKLPLNITSSQTLDSFKAALSKFN